MTDVDAIMLLEGGDCSEEEQIEAFQALIDSGVVWQLQGSYGRAANALIEAGLCSPKGA
jgi:hypothetical protein